MARYIGWCYRLNYNLICGSWCCVEMPTCAYGVIASRVVSVFHCNLLLCMCVGQYLVLLSPPLWILPLLPLFSLPLLVEYQFINCGGCNLLNRQRSQTGLILLCEAGACEWMKTFTKSSRMAKSCFTLWRYSTLYNLQIFLRWCGVDVDVACACMLELAWGGMLGYVRFPFWVFDSSSSLLCVLSQVLSGEDLSVYGRLTRGTMRIQLIANCNVSFKFLVRALFIRLVVLSLASVQLEDCIWAVKRGKWTIFSHWILYL